MLHVLRQLDCRLCFSYRLIIVSRVDCCADRFHHIQVHVGNFGVDQREDNELCAQMEGPVSDGSQVIMTCANPIEGTNVFVSTYVQRVQGETLDIEEILVFGKSQSS